MSLFFTPCLLFAGQDPTPFRESVISYCSKEASKSLMRECILDSAKKISLIESMSKTSQGRSIVASCANSLNLKDPQALYHLMNCAHTQNKLYSNHPDPKWLSENLKMDTYRSEWVSVCFKKHGGDVSSCVKKHEAGFRVFWQDYKNIKEKTDTIWAMLERCTSVPLRKTNFSKYLICRSMKG